MKKYLFQTTSYIFEIQETAMNHFEVHVNTLSGMDISMEVYPHRIHRFEDCEAIIRIFLNKHDLQFEWTHEQAA